MELGRGMSGRVQVCRAPRDLLGVLDAGGGPAEVPLLLVEQTQLVEREGDQVVVEPDPTLTESAHTENTCVIWHGNTRV